MNSLAGARAELEALRKRHSSALELMGERDEQVEELRADLADVKQMYREQIDLLVNQVGSGPYNYGFDYFRAHSVFFFLFTSRFKI